MAEYPIEIAAQAAHNVIGSLDEWVEPEKGAQHI